MRHDSLYKTRKGRDTKTILQERQPQADVAELHCLSINPKPETLNPKPYTLNPKPETLKPCADCLSWPFEAEGSALGAAGFGFRGCQAGNRSPGRRAPEPETRNPKP